MQQKFFKFLTGCAIIASCLVACSNPENEAREMLNQGLLMKQDGKLVEAEETFKEIASQYAKTKVATEAIKELEKMKTKNQVSTLFSDIATQTVSSLFIEPAMQDYENRTKCSQCESDANHIAGALAGFFSDPYHTKLPTEDELKPFFYETISNSYSISGDLDNIIIQVTDGSGLCPKEYQDEYYNDERSNWNNGVFTKIIK